MAEAAPRNKGGPSPTEFLRTVARWQAPWSPPLQRNVGQEADKKQILSKFVSPDEWPEIFP